ncbi:hypothetical protein JG688_00011633 [Phytophthora aleatoria]|uniref:Uncharacterized protein n=1 Tax=Phytophthora aleatoria TaxID=2496075 RepID=A0A8J5ILM6_9STRA|nr:hypothetical protein JG688_00011633 [Phytophthora aleatoria]
MAQSTDPGREPKVLKPTDTGPFIVEDDGMRRPAWQATLTTMCHDQRRKDPPSALQEHVDVPNWIGFRSGACPPLTATG